jgi:hypothetical protein
MAAMLGAIAFDPTIRGILVVVVGVVVLMGSIYLIIATNSGARAGLLIALAGLFGWMFLMGTVWWIYGIGLKGRDPAWMPVELNYTREAPVATDVVETLPPADELPDPQELVDDHPLVVAVAMASEGADWEPTTLTDLVTALTPQATVTAEDVAETIRPGMEKNSQEFIDANPELDPILAQSDEDLAEDISSEAVELRAKIEDDLGGWCLLSETDTRRGEAVASSDAALVAHHAFGDPTTTADYITHDVFFHGGKEPCTPVTEKSVLGRAWHRIATTFEFKNPKLYSAVTVQKALDQETIPGQPPPVATEDPDASTVTMVMLRNLGNRRFIPFVFTLINFLLFAIVCSQLHVRDKRAMAARAEFEASK